MKRLHQVKHELIITKLHVTSRFIDLHSESARADVHITGLIKAVALGVCTLQESNGKAGSERAGLQR